MNKYLWKAPSFNHASAANGVSYGDFSPSEVFMVYMSF